MFNIFYSLHIKKFPFSTTYMAEITIPRQLSQVEATSTVLVQGHPIKLAPGFAFHLESQQWQALADLPQTVFHEDSGCCFIRIPSLSTGTVGEMISPLLIIFTGSHHVNVFLNAWTLHYKWFWSSVLICSVSHRGLRVCCLSLSAKLS